MTKWIQEAIKRPGRVRRYLKRVYGSKAFRPDGEIKKEYLQKALKRAERTGNKSLAAAIRLAFRLKKWAWRREMAHPDKPRKRRKKKRSKRRKK